MQVLVNVLLRLAAFARRQLNIEAPVQNTRAKEQHMNIDYTHDTHPNTQNQHPPQVATTPLHLLNRWMQLSHTTAARQFRQTQQHLVEIGQIVQHHRIEHIGVAQTEMSPARIHKRLDVLAAQKLGQLWPPIEVAHIERIRIEEIHQVAQQHTVAQRFRQYVDLGVGPVGLVIGRYDLAARQPGGAFAPQVVHGAGAHVIGGHGCRRRRRRSIDVGRER